MFKTGTRIKTNIGELTIENFLGKGKSGYSYLTSSDSNQYVFKSIHYEHCPYYKFGNSNKVDVEVYSYQILKNLGIPIPKLLDCNRDKNYIIKEYINGYTASYSIAKNLDIEYAIEQLFKIYITAKKTGINIDYFPSNFVISNNKLYYIDYEHNNYDSNWDLVNWGIFYWANSKGMKNYLQYNDLKYINESSDSGIPIKAPFFPKINQWINKFMQATND